MDIICSARRKDGNSAWPTIGVAATVVVTDFARVGALLMHVVYHSGDDHRDVRGMTARDEFPDLQAILHEIQRSKPFASITR
jgi:hypothetical protein